MEKVKQSKWWIIGSVLLFFCIVAGTGLYYAYRLLRKPNFMPKETVYVYIDEQKDFENLYRQLQDSGNMQYPKDFKWLAERLEYPSNMRTGRYVIKPDMNNLELLNNLRRGNQAATRITFNNIRLLEDLAKRLDEQLMLNADDLMQRLTDPAYCDSLGFNTETIKAMFIPNTYEVYWNISPDGLINRMKREYDNFWTEEKLSKAKAINLSPVEISVLASIVEEETAIPDEYPIVAGLYINRLHKGMLLQADPTVKYAVGDFMLQRILYKHLETDSPYNTYIYPGLPPGPLRIPTIQGLNSVLNYTRHNYIYMVAKEDFSGRHNFSVTLSEHNRHANRYRQELNNRNIR